jgi:MoxR-like ATPase
MVAATQNPIELEGPFPLPEAQIDRFLMRISLGYPDEESENQVLLRFRSGDPLEELEPIATAADLLALHSGVNQIKVEETVRKYLVRVVRATRDHPAVDLGVSPRGTLVLYHTAQSLAAIRGRGFVLPDDVKYLAPYVLTHRILISQRVRLRGRTPAQVVAEIVSEVPVPVEG